MLKSIPLGILTHTVTVKVPSGADAYGVISYAETEVAHVHIQPVHQFRKTKDDRNILLTGILYWDVRRSGAFDWMAAEAASEATGCQCNVARGAKTYTVVATDYLPDDEGKPHHVEVMLV